MNRILQTVFLLSLIVFALGRESRPKPSSTLHTFSKRKANASTCNDDEPYFPYLLAESNAADADTMLENAHQRLVALDTYLNQDHPPSLHNADVKLASTFRTWSSMMFAKLPIQGSLESDERRRSLYQLSAMIDFIAHMLEQTEGGDDAADTVLVFCNDDWLSPINPNGKTPPRQDEFWDMRPLPEAEEKKKEWIRIRSGKFGDRKPDDRVFEVFDHLAGPVSSAIVLNPHQFAKWSHSEKSEFQYHRFTDETLKIINEETTLWEPVPVDLRSNHLRFKKKTPPPVGSIPLSSMVNGHLSAVLLAAYSQLKGMTPPGKTMLGTNEDQSAGAAGETAWEMVTTFAKDHPEVAARYTRNFVYLVVALFLDNFDWSTGFNRHLSAARRD